MEYQPKFLLIKRFLLGLAITCLWLTFVNANEPKNTLSTAQYLEQLERHNQISFDKILNTRGAYIPSMCYTKTSDENEDVVNPCYSCHTTGTIPNFLNDTNLQQELLFPKEMLTNPYSNLFKNHSKKVEAQSDTEILNYVRISNYQKNHQLILAEKLPKDWPGYRPDSYFNFDPEGFDRRPDGGYSLWRAFRYYPFPGTFWPTNGSTDDVLIRLDPVFSKSKKGRQDIAIYNLNLVIVESLIKQKSIQLKQPINEKIYQLDFNQNGVLDSTQTIKFPPKSYVGLAANQLQQGKFHLAPGLYPENTEFLHSVRYLDWDESLQRVTLSPRMKELRYSKKYRWMTYSELETDANREFWEAQTSNHSEPPLMLFSGDAKKGMHTSNGWLMQGFIEDKAGDLRPQTREEIIYCLGCHTGIGATSDASFAMPRKLEGKNYDYGWQHWNQKWLQKIAEPKASYKNNSNVYEYSFYLQNNHSANEFGENPEVKDKFYSKNGSKNLEAFKQLKADISFLLLPSKQRALELNKAYRVTVRQQSYIYGREGNVNSMKNLHQTVKPNQNTDIITIISK